MTLFHPYNSNVMLTRLEELRDSEPDAERRSEISSLVTQVRDMFSCANAAVYMAVHINEGGQTFELSHVINEMIPFWSVTDFELMERSIPGTYAFTSDEWAEAGFFDVSAITKEPGDVDKESTE